MTVTSHCLYTLSCLAFSTCIACTQRVRAHTHAHVICALICATMHPPAAEQEYIARFGHGSAKLARQAQSKEKTLDKMVRSGLTERVESDRVVKLKFENVGKLPPPVLQFADVAFGYSPDKVLYR